MPQPHKNVQTFQVFKLCRVLALFTGKKHKHNSTKIERSPHKFGLATKAKLEFALAPLGKSAPPCKFERFRCSPAVHWIALATSNRSKSSSESEARVQALVGV